MDNPQRVALILLSVALVWGLMSLAQSTVLRGVAFHLELGNGGGLGLGIAEQNVTLTIASGTLNSSTTTLQNSYKDGWLIFNSSSLGTMDVDYSSGLEVVYDGGRFDSGNTLAFTALGVHVLRWDAVIYDPYEHFTELGIGIFGFVLVGFGCFWGAAQLLNREAADMKIQNIMMALFVLLCGCGFIIGWLW